jgi:hypothetical protein
MGGFGKSITLLLILMVGISCLTLIIKPANAQTTSSQKPASPEFTLTFIPASETLTHVDPLTGAKTFELVDKSTIQVKIKNQPFQENINGIHYYLFYSIFVAGHFDPSNQSYWQYAYNFPYNYTSTPPWNKILEATTSEYTTATIWSGDYPAHSQIDIHIGAMLMHDGQFRVYNNLGDLAGHLVSGIVVGETSGSVQTFTIPEHQTSTNSPNPTASSLEPNPTSIITSTPESTASTSSSTPRRSTENGVISLPLITFIVIIVVLVLVIISLLFLLLYHRAKQNSVLIKSS